MEFTLKIDRCWVVCNTQDRKNIIPLKVFVTKNGADVFATELMGKNKIRSLDGKDAIKIYEIEID